MTAHPHVSFGPRLVATATGRLRGAVLVRPSAAIESAEPLSGEPGAIYARALEQHDVFCKTLEYFGVETTVVESHGPILTRRAPVMRPLLSKMVPP